MWAMDVKSKHYTVVNANLWSLLVIFISITINPTQATQRFERRPEGTYQRLRGQDLDLPCVVRHLQGECLWLKNNKVQTSIASKYKFDRQPSNGDCSLRIFNLDTALDEGEWQCQVTQPSLTVMGLSSEPVKVVVLVAPSPPFLQKVESNRLNLLSDRSNEVECISQNGNPAPRMEWYIDGENVTTHSRTNIDSVTGDSPKVTSVLSYIFKRMHRNSTLSCLSIHQTVSQNTSARINVLYAPQVTVPQKVYTINEGNSLRVDCLVDSNPPTNAVWKALDPSHQFRTEYRSNSLIIDSVTKRMDRAVFECSARNEYGASNEEQITLDVLFEPTLVSSSDPQQSVELGESLRLFCNYEGNPRPKIMWFHINPITDQVRNRPNDENNANELVISNATYHDEGHYYCEALNHNRITNKELIVRSAKIIVDIMGRPAIIQKKNTAYGYSGKDTDVEQAFCSDPTPSQVYWQYGSMRVDIKNDGQHDRNHLIPENNISKSMRHKARPLIAMDKHSSWPKPTCFKAILSIANTDLSDERDYTLFVENSRGVTQSIIKLKVNSPVSAAIMITIGLIVLIMLLALTLVTMLVIKRRKLAKEKADDESKAEARAPIKSDTDKPEKEPEKGKVENHELVYANLDFVKPDTKPSKAKPQAQQRQHKTNGGNSGTEYAQITFTNKADL